MSFFKQHNSSAQLYDHGENRDHHEQEHIFAKLSVILTTKTSLHKYQLLLNFLLKTRAYSFLLPGYQAGSASCP
ncbi:hypothetical protein Y032_0265g659 [Ancylostoma ceylanicum]|nr:hypothetical protein Y032_0265g659 [Ancylostoma ceylanicum]